MGRGHAAQSGCAPPVGCPPDGGSGSFGVVQLGWGGFSSLTAWGLAFQLLWAPALLHGCCGLACASPCAWDIRGQSCSVRPALFAGGVVGQAIRVAQQRGGVCSWSSSGAFPVAWRCGLACGRRAHGASGASPAACGLRPSRAAPLGWRYVAPSSLGGRRGWGGIAARGATAMALLHGRGFLHGRRCQRRGDRYSSFCAGLLPASALGGARWCSAMGRPWRLFAASGWEGP